MSSVTVDDLRYLANVRLVDAIMAYAERRGIMQNVMSAWRVARADQLKRELRVAIGTALGTVVHQLIKVMYEDQVKKALVSFVVSISPDKIADMYPEIEQYITLGREQLLSYIVEETVRILGNVDMDTLLSTLLERAKAEVSQLGRLSEDARCALLATLVYSATQASAYKTEFATLLATVLAYGRNIVETCATTFRRVRRPNLRALISSLSDYAIKIIDAIRDADVFRQLPPETIINVALAVANISSFISSQLPEAQRTQPPSIERVEEVAETARPTTAGPEGIYRECGDDNNCLWVISKLIEMVTSIGYSRQSHMNLLHAVLSRPSSIRAMEGTLAIAASTSIGRDCNIKVIEQGNALTGIDITCGRYGVKLVRSGDNVELYGIIGVTTTSAKIVVEGLGYMFNNKYKTKFDELGFLYNFTSVLGELSVARTERRTFRSESELADAFTTAMLSMMPETVGRGVPQSFKVLRLTNSAVFVPATPVGYFMCTKRIRSSIMNLSGLACSMPGFLVTARNPDEFMSENLAVEVAYMTATGSPETVRQYGVNVYSTYLTMYVVLGDINYVGYNIHLDDRSRATVDAYLPSRYVDRLTAQQVTQINNLLLNYERVVSVGLPSELLDTLETFRQTFINIVPAEAGVMPFPTVQALEELQRIAEVVPRPMYTFREFASDVTSAYEALERKKEKAEEYRRLAMAGLLDREETKEMIRDIMKLDKQLERAATQLARRHARAEIETIARELLLSQAELPFGAPERFLIPERPPLDDVEPAVMSRINKLMPSIGLERQLQYNVVVLSDLTAILRAYDVSPFCDMIYSQYPNNIRHAGLVGVAELLCTTPEDRFTSLTNLAQYLRANMDRLKTDTAKRLAATLISMHDFLAKRPQLVAQVPRLSLVLGELRGIRKDMCYCWPTQIQTS